MLLLILFLFIFNLGLLGLNPEASIYADPSYTNPICSNNCFDLPKICAEPSGQPLIISRINVSNDPNQFSRFNGYSNHSNNTGFYNFINDNIKIKPYGYIKFEIYADSRQVIGTGNDQLLLIPEPILISKDGKDINDHGQLGMSVYETRLGFELIGNKIRHVNTRGIFEIDLRGINEDELVAGLPESKFEITLGALRVRLAFVEFYWKDFELLTGLDWHPLAARECYPHTVSYNRGFPFDPGDRNPQVRFTWKPKNLELAFSALSQIQFESPGPVGNTAKYIRDAIVPNLNFRTIYSFENCEDTLLGFCVDYKRLVPRLVTDKCFATKSDVNSVIFEIFGSVLKAPWSARAKIIWAQNGADQGLISGYGVTCIDPKTDIHIYTPSAAFSAWFDFSYLLHCDKMELGFFAGYTKNLGTSEPLDIHPVKHKPILFTLTKETNCIDYAARFAPRFVYAWDNIRFGIELEWTRAAFGCIDRFARVKNSCPVDNVRLLSAIFYYF